MGQRGYIPSTRYEDINEIETKYLNSNNIVGRNDEIQTERFFHTFENAEQETLTYILTDDIILTSVVLNVNHGEGGGEEYGELYINDDLLLKLVTPSGVTSPIQATNILTLPNWTLPAGTILKSVSSEGGAGSGSVQSTFIGYYS